MFAIISCISQNSDFLILVLLLEVGILLLKIKKKIQMNDINNKDMTHQMVMNYSFSPLKRQGTDFFSVYKFQFKCLVEMLGSFFHVLVLLWTYRFHRVIVLVPNLSSRNPSSQLLQPSDMPLLVSYYLWHNRISQSHVILFILRPSIMHFSKVS